MKAIKIYKIKWNLDGVSAEKKNELLKKLPTSKGFMAQDSFDVVERVPDLLKKHYGCDVITYSYSEIKIIEDFNELLKFFTPKGEKPKKLFLKDGELSVFGEERVNDLKNAIHKRFYLQEKGTNDDEMPKIQDIVMLSLEKIFNINWEDMTEKDVMKLVEKELTPKPVNLKDEYDDDDDDDDDDDKEEE